MHMGVSEYAGAYSAGLIQNPPADITRMYETVDNLDTDSAAELEYKAWEDACAWKCQNALTIRRD